MIDLSIKNEFSSLKSVILGLGKSMGSKPKIEEAIDPKSISSLKHGVYPLEKDIVFALNQFKNILLKHGVEVFRPTEIPDCNQVFTRDIAFVLFDKIIIPNIINERSTEQEGLKDVISLIDSKKILRTPSDVHIEGGDVIVHNDFVFVGYSEKKDFSKYKVARTNSESLNFLKNHFPDKEIIGLELLKSDVNIFEGALHLDCCLQPLGKENILICFDILKNEESKLLLRNIFKSYNIIELNLQQMSNLNSNLFSISSNVIVSDVSFSYVNSKLESSGFIVEKIDYSEISKMGGLFRCSTMPLIRK